MIASKQNGFTLVELILAMAIFSFMLLIILIGFLTIVHLHQSGIAMRDAQQNARYASEDVVRTFRSATDATVTPTANPNLNTLCLTVGGASVLYRVDATGRLLRDTFTLASCPPGFVTETALTSASVNVIGFSIDRQSSGGLALASMIRLSVASVSSYTFTGSAGTMTCTPGQAASQYCSVANIITASSTRNSL